MSWTGGNCKLKGGQWRRAGYSVVQSSLGAELNIQTMRIGLESMCRGEKMKLRSTILGAVAAVAMIGAAISPSLAADQPQVNANVTLNDVGTFQFWLWGAVHNLGSVNVSTTTGGNLPYEQVLQVNDERAFSPGYSLQIAVTDFSDGGGHTIEASNVTLNTQRFNRANSCIGGSAPAPVPSNPYQSVANVTGSGNADVHVGPLTYSQTVVSAGPGRGCGDFYTGLTNNVNIPAGTYAQAGGTTYTSTITVSNTSAAP